MTLAPETVGAPTVSLSPPTISTRSNVNGLPASVSRRSISKVSPAVTRYCLPPVSNTAYINLFSRKGSEMKPELHRGVNACFWKFGSFQPAELLFLPLGFRAQQLLRAPTTRLRERGEVKKLLCHL